MGQVGVVYMGKTWKLLQALNLRDKESINPDEARTLVEGGKLCLDQGVNIMTEGSDGPEAAQVIDALLDITRSLVQKAKVLVDSENNGRIPSDESLWLSKRVREVEKESMYLSKWSGWMHTPRNSGYDA